MAPPQKSKDTDTNIDMAETEVFITNDLNNQSDLNESILAKVRSSKTGAKCLTQEEYRKYAQELQEEKRQDQEREKRANENIENITKSLPYKIILYIVIGIWFTLPFIAVIIGSIFHGEGDCPAEPIALTIIITGVVMVIIDMNHLFIPIIRKYLVKRSSPSSIDRREEVVGTTTEPSDEETGQHIWKWCLFFILLVLKIFGCIYACIIVYRLYPNVEYDATKGSPYYCNKTLYLVSFWVLTSWFIMIGVLIALGCFAVIAGHATA